MERNYLNEPLADQLLGNSCEISPFNAAVLREHKRLLQEGDGFSTVSVYHLDERSELRDHAQHRYQWIINEAVQHLRMPVWHLRHQKIWFNFYGELVRRFGAGTQGYTTESDLPHIGISEISLRDPEVLQMVLLHEAQHATDFAFYDGFVMSVSERELRARLTVAQAIKAAKGQHHALYQTAALDAAQWFLIFAMSRAADEGLRQYYYADLEPLIQRLLRRGVRFSPAALQVLRPELSRERLRVLADVPYAVSSDGGKMRIRANHTPVPEPEEEAEPAPAQPEGEAEPSAESLLAGLAAATGVAAPSSLLSSSVRLASSPADDSPLGPTGADPAETSPHGGQGDRERHTLNNIDDWHNFPVIHQQLSERIQVVTDAWAKYEIDPTLPLPQTPPPPTPVFRSHQELLRYKAQGAGAASGRKHPT